MKEKYFVIIAVMVVGTVVAVGFVLWSNRNLPAETLTKIQKAANPCLGLSADEGGVSCEEAKNMSLEKYPGKVNSVQFGTTKFQQGLQGTPRDIEVWFVGITLDSPVKTPVGKMGRVVVSVDIASFIEPFVNQFF